MYILGSIPDFRVDAVDLVSYQGADAVSVTDRATGGKDRAHGDRRSEKIANPWLRRVLLERVFELVT
jgi:hypothetical protein